MNSGFKSEQFENIANLKPQSADLILLNVLFVKTTDKDHTSDKGELALHDYLVIQFTCSIVANLFQDKD